MEEKDFFIVLIGFSGAIISIFGGFLLSISFNLKNKKRETDLKMQLLYLEITKEQKKLPFDLIKKISIFENESHQYSLYLDGGFEYKSSPYTSMLDFSDLKKNNNKNKRLVNKIKKHPGHLECSKNFDTFARYTNLNIDSKNIEEYKKIYDLFSKYKSFSEYSEYLSRNLSDSFSESEKEIYHKFIEQTKVKREKLWNLSLTLPSFKFDLMYFLGVIYLIVIGSLGVLFPFKCEEYLSKGDVQDLMTCVCLLTFAYILLVFLSSYTSINPRKLKKEIRKYYY